MSLVPRSITTPFAMPLAQVLFERWSDADEAVAACVISHHNLADLHLRLNQPGMFIRQFHNRADTRCQSFFA